MGADSKIAWTDHTFNPWWGCLEHGPGCLNCYARALAKRYGHDCWGASPRRQLSEKYWNDPRRWNKAALASGIRARVFAGSMCDVMESLPAGHPSEEDIDLCRSDLWKLIEETPALDWLLCTKRPENYAKLLPARWLGTVHGKGLPPNVWLLASATNQAELVLATNALAEVPGARVRGISAEPLLGPVDVACLLHKPDWLILGAESGYHARRAPSRWFHESVGLAREAQVPVFVKQVHRAAAGDGFVLEDDLSQFPAALRIRQWPEVRHG